MNNAKNKYLSYKYYQYIKGLRSRSGEVFSMQKEIDVYRTAIFKTQETCPDLQVRIIA